MFIYYFSVTSCYITGHLYLWGRISNEIFPLNINNKVWLSSFTYQIKHQRYSIACIYIRINRFHFLYPFTNSIILILPQNESHCKRIYSIHHHLFNITLSLFNCRSTNQQIYLPMHDFSL